MEEKLCAACKRLKPVVEFSGLKSAKSGLYWYCKTCAAAKTAASKSKDPAAFKRKAADRARKWRRANLEKVRAQDRARARQRPGGPSKDEAQKILLVSELRALLKKRGWKQADAADRLGMNRSTFRGYFSLRHSTESYRSIIDRLAKIEGGGLGREGGE